MHYESVQVSALCASDSIGLHWVHDRLLQISELGGRRR